MNEPTTPRSREAQLLQAFVRMADTLVDDYDVAEVLTELSAHCVQLLDADAAGLVLANQRGELELAAASVEQTRLLELFQILSQEGPCRDCFRTGEAVLVADISQYTERWPKFAPVVLDQGYRSVHSVPLRLRQETIGALNLFGCEATSPDESDLEVARALAATATIGILQERSIRRGEVLTEQLQHALNSRIVIEQAKGVIAHATNHDVETSFQRLREYARRNNLRISDLAWQIVQGVVAPADVAAGLERVRSAT